jgi:hypothetical protein
MTQFFVSTGRLKKPRQDEPLEERASISLSEVIRRVGGNIEDPPQFGHSVIYKVNVPHGNVRDFHTLISASNLQIVEPK